MSAKQTDEVYMPEFVEVCNICPRNCGIDRNVKKGFCGSDSRIMITRAAPHMWEEPCISGKNGSGAVFFSGCNLHCVYCQNKAISDGGVGKEVSIERLAEIFLDLQDKNVYNINLVTPTHYALAIKEAVKLARKRCDRGTVLSVTSRCDKENRPYCHADGLKNDSISTRENIRKLHIPVVYNCGGYESVETIKALEDTVDIWMPDFKYMSSETAKKYSNCPDYFERATEALDEMVRQIRGKGGTRFQLFPDSSEDNVVIMTQGVIVRHMMLPGHIGESKRILRFLHERYGNDIYISIMSQYTPMPQILESDRFPELKTKVDRDEYNRLVDFALKIGIENAFIQEEDVASESFIPAFDCEGA